MAEASGRGLPAAKQIRREVLQSPPKRVECNQSPNGGGTYRREAQ